IRQYPAVRSRPRRKTPALICCKSSEKRPWILSCGELMTTNYDPIAEKYKRAKQQPWRTHVESYTLMELIGNVAGKSVVDLACGEGYYTRMLRHAGAAKAVGVDLSQG